MDPHPVSISVAVAVASLLTASALLAQPKVSPAPSPPPKELRVTVQTPTGSINNDNLELFKQRVETGTKGAVKIAIFPQARLVEDSKVLSAVVAGQVEMGGSRIGHFADAVPGIGIFLLPFMFNLIAVQDAALKPDSPFRRLLDAAILEKTGARVLWWSPFGTSILLSKSKPAASPSTMAGKTVRTADKISESFVRACGGLPVYAGGAEHYDAYKLGRAEIGQSGITFVVARRLWEVMDTLTNTRHLADGMVIVINEQLWQGLSADHRRVLQEAAVEAQNAILADLYQREKEGYALAEKNGMKIHEITPDQVAEWRTCSAPVLEAFMTNSGKLGMDLLAAYGWLRTQPCCTAGVPGHFTRR